MMLLTDPDTPCRVHLWSVSLDDACNDLPELLSTDELLRLGRISHASARQAFLRSRVATRRVLAEYLSYPAEQISFSYNSNGKPGLGDDKQALDFNVSHSRQHCIIAVSKGQRVGVDIEPVSAGRDYHALARRFFTPAENRLLSSTTDEMLFYRIWTLKEAHIKARGLKLLDGLDRFECRLNSADGLAVIDGSADQAESWSHHQWQFAPGYEAAVVVACDRIEMQTRRL
jgi:4'-phosphopantetheinyl transferase